MSDHDAGLNSAGPAADRVSGRTRRLRPGRALLVGLLALAGLWATGQRGTGADGSPAAEPIALFPATYEESRDRFRQACADALVRHPGACRQFAVAGQAETDLTIDYAYLTNGGSRLLVVESGVHGPESYAGAAVQALLLRDLADRLLARGIDLLLIHAVNPWGFRHGRRADEANVNLNRNFGADDAMYRLEAPGYAALRSVVEPDGSPGSVWWDSLLIDVRLLWALVASGFDYQRIEDGMNTGQYGFPRGLNYGGTAPRPPVRFLASEIGPILRAHAGPVLFLDVHTGLGDRGVLHVMTGSKAPTAAVAQAEALFGGLMGDGIEITPPTAAGFYIITGDVVDFVPGLAADPGRVLGLTLEYGTMGTGTLAQLASAARMILENQAWFNGCTDPAVCAEIRANFLDLFNPADPAWRAAVLREARRVLGRVEERF